MSLNSIIMIIHANYANEDSGPPIRLSFSFNSYHPVYKQDVSHRLALAALGVAYHKNVQYQGPFPKSITQDSANHRLHIKYDHGPIDAKNSNGFEVMYS